MNAILEDRDRLIEEIAAKNHKIVELEAALQRALELVVYTEQMNIALMEQIKNLKCKR